MSKIALVEDDASMRSLLTTLLQLEGFSVIAFQQYQEQDILTSLRENFPEVLIMDVHLLNVNNANGIEILRRIKQDNQLRNLHVIMVSGMDFSEQCVSAGADGFLMKPYMPDDLISLIRKHTN
jgi:CheY-like chemotaxis protein